MGIIDEIKGINIPNPRANKTALVVGYIDILTPIVLNKALLVNYRPNNDNNKPAITAGIT
jgi:hypothetical protein